MRPALFLTLVAVPALASAQTSTPARSILTPPNPIERATSASDQRAADARRAAEADRASAARSAPARSTGVPNSTFTDGVAGFGTSPADSATTPTPPPR
jgi:hypothetical protein